MSFRARHHFADGSRIATYLLQTISSTWPTSQVAKIFEMGLSSFGDFCVQSKQRIFQWFKTLHN
jgi:hypothetical protein